jgi:hypothetical protein
MSEIEKYLLFMGFDSDSYSCFFLPRDAPVVLSSKMPIGGA